MSRAASAEIPGVSARSNDTSPTPNAFPGTPRPKAFSPPSVGDRAHMPPPSNEPTGETIFAYGEASDDAASEASTNPVEAYATQREKLREAAEAIAAGKTPGVDLRAFVESAEAMVESSADEEREKRSA